MRQIEAGTIDLVFADPPFNIGYEYDEYHDRQDDDEYLAWSRQWIAEVHRVLKPGGTFWLAIGDEYAAELKVDAEHKIGFATRSWVVWYYTFGVNCTKKFSRSHAHLFHFVKDENNFTFNAEDPQVRVPSARALVYADKRANPAGRLPDDTWVLRPQDLPDGFQPTDDTWYFARVAGTFKERQGFHGCQMPEQLLGRIIRVEQQPGRHRARPIRRQRHDAGRRQEARPQVDRLRALGRIRPRRDGAARSAQGRRRTRRPRRSDRQRAITANGRKLEAKAEPKTMRRRICNRLRRPRRQVHAESAAAAAVAECRTKPLAKRDLRDVVRDAIVESFYAAHDGYSIDWLLANPHAARPRFTTPAAKPASSAARPIGIASCCGFRKTGEFPKRGPIKKVHVTDDELDAYSFAAEIAWRLTSDKFDGPSLDEIFCDPAKAAFFDRTAKRFAPGFEPAQYRWAALRLRKASRELVDEVKQYHFVFAKRDFTRFQAWQSLQPVATTPASPASTCCAAQQKSRSTSAARSTLAAGSRSTPIAARSRRRRAHLASSPATNFPAQSTSDAFKEDLVRRYQPKWNVNLVGLESTCASQLEARFVTAAANCCHSSSYARTSPLAMS